MTPCLADNGAGEPGAFTVLFLGRWQTRSPTSNFRLGLSSWFVDLGAGDIGLEVEVECWGTYEHTLDAGLCWASCTPVPPAFLDGNLGISKTEARELPL